jgi:hypothetical protein
VVAQVQADGDALTPVKLPFPGLLSLWDVENVNNVMDCAELHPLPSKI